jgi:hypothetical protein
MKRAFVVAAILGAALLPAHALATKDTTPPAAVSNLAVGIGVHTAAPTWTDTGDDGFVGTASSFEVRYSSVAITEANWSTCPIFCSGTPGPSGTPECCSAAGLTPGGIYYFAVRLKDDAHNISPLSNVVQIITHTSGNEVGC